MANDEPVAQPKHPIVREFEKTVGQLSDILHINDPDAPNVLTLNQFKPFIALFRTPDEALLQRTDVIEALTKSYLKLIDPYRITNIVDDHHPDQILITLDRIFTPANSMVPSRNNVITRSSLTNAAGKGSNPLFGTQLLNSLCQMALDSQFDDTHLQRLIADQKLHQTLADQLKGPSSPETTSTSSEETGATQLGGVEWDFA